MREASPIEGPLTWKKLKATLEAVVQVEHGEHDGVRWTSAALELPTRYQHRVLRLAGYEERTPTPIQRTEVAGASVGIIIESGPPLRIDGAPGPGSFVVGPNTRPSMTAHDGRQSGIQIELTPLMFSALFSMPASELIGQVVPLDALPTGRDIAERVADHSDWGSRLQEVLRWFDRCDRHAAADAEVAFLQSALLRSQGRRRLAPLMADLSTSERTIIRRFERVVGLKPKRYARLLRFDQIIAGLRQRQPLVDLALAVGCYDQSHLVREVKAFSGMTPVALQRVMEATPRPVAAERLSAMAACVTPKGRA